MKDKDKKDIYEIFKNISKLDEQDYEAITNEIIKLKKISYMGRNEFRKYIEEKYIEENSNKQHRLYGLFKKKAWKLLTATTHDGTPTYKSKTEPKEFVDAVNKILKYHMDLYNKVRK